MPDCVAIIPAKGTSKRLPRKNLCICAGKTLLHRAMEVARLAGIFQEIIISSECSSVHQHVITSAKEILVPYVFMLEDRPEILSREGVSVAAVVFDILARRRYIDDSFCVLWPTSPLRTAQFIRSMWDTFDRYKYESFHSSSARTHLHEGTAIFMRTPLFLKRLSLDFRLGDPYAIVPDEMVCDVNTPEDLAEAERRLLAREGTCQSS